MTQSKMTQDDKDMLLLYGAGQATRLGFFVVLKKFCREVWQSSEEAVVIFHPSVTREQVEAHITTLPKTYFDTWFEEQPAQYKVYQAPYIFGDDTKEA